MNSKNVKLLFPLNSLHPTSIKTVHAYSTAWHILRVILHNASILKFPSSYSFILVSKNVVLIFCPENQRSTFEKEKNRMNSETIQRYILESQHRITMYIL